MKTFQIRLTAARVLFALVAAMAAAMPAHAARVGVLSNKYATETAADFNARIPTHAFTAVDTSLAIPTLQSLNNAFDVVLVFEDSTYGNATPVGNALAAFANGGRAVVIGTFYDQDRSDAPAINSPHGWGRSSRSIPTRPMAPARLPRHGRSTRRRCWSTR